MQIRLSPSATVHGATAMAKNEEKMTCMLKFQIAKNLPTNYLHIENPNYKNIPMELSRDAIALYKQGRLNEALSLLDKIDSNVFKPNLFIGNTFVSMYSKGGRLREAHRVLEAMPLRNVVSWTTMISASCKHGHYDEALNLFYQMQREGIEPNDFTFSSVLPAFANLGDLKQGKAIHADICKRGFGTNAFVGSALVNMYVKCGHMKDARQMFDKMSKRNSVCWTVIIAGKEI